MACRVSARTPHMPNRSDKVDPFWTETRRCLQAAVQSHESCLQTKDAEALAAEALRACRNDPKAALAILVAITKIQRAVGAARAQQEQAESAADTSADAPKLVDTELLVPQPSTSACDNAENAKPAMDTAKPMASSAAAAQQPLGNALKRNIPASFLSSDALKPASPPLASEAPAGPSAGAALPNCFETNGFEAAAPDAAEPMEASAAAPEGAPEDAPEAHLTSVYPSWDYGAYLTDRPAPDMDVDTPTEDLLSLGYDHPGQFNTIDFDQVAQA